VAQFRPVSSDAKALDGLNVQIATCDEIASHKMSEFYDVLPTAMGKRRHPLVAISTATSNNSGIGKQVWDYAVRVLEGAPVHDRLFAPIHTTIPKMIPGRKRRGSRPVLPGARWSSRMPFAPSPHLSGSYPKDSLVTAVPYG
jgi:hypothetical protein